MKETTRPPGPLPKLASKLNLPGLTCWISQANPMSPSQVASKSMTGRLDWSREAWVQLTEGAAISAANCSFMERLKFLLIFSSNLDEFFEIRVAGLKKQITFAREQAGADGLQPHQALARISELVHGHVDRQYAILNDILLPELEKHQVRFIRRRHWTTKIKTWVRKIGRAHV